MTERTIIPVHPDATYERDPFSSLHHWADDLCDFLTEKVVTDKTIFGRIMRIVLAIPYSVTILVLAVALFPLGWAYDLTAATVNWIALAPGKAEKVKPTRARLVNAVPKEGAEEFLARLPRRKDGSIPIIQGDVGEFLSRLSDAPIGFPQKPVKVGFEVEPIEKMQPRG